MSPTQSQGRQVLIHLYGALRALKLYPLENDAVQQALAELHRGVTELLEREDGMELRVVGEFFFLNEVRLRLDLSNFATFGTVAQALQDHGIGAVEVAPGMAETEWAPFLSLLLRKPEGDDPWDTFQARMADTPVQHVVVRAAREVAGELDEEEALEQAKRTYAQSVRVAREILGDVRLGRAVNVRKVKRAVQGIVDQVLSNEPSMLTMTTLRDFDEYTFTHSVNVCILSVIIGQRIGLDRRQLYELGMGALLHDLGKMRIPVGVLNKPGALDEEEWLQLKEHPTDGLLSLFHMGGFTDMPYRQMLMAYEHHMKIDLTGYPTNRRPRNPTLFSRIVAVADGFDAATSIRSYQHIPFPPDRVLQEMRENPRRGYDPLLVKVLITATGIFPVGTLVILDSYELAVVSAVNPNPDLLHLPRVRIISDAMGVPLAEPLTLDLAELDPATGRPVRAIVKTVEPQKYGIRVADYLL
ncbi:MAG: HD domain-containing protein [Longimicrobiales bacterium]|nr:HD domain-containing protein [Longimicrobiales bacterium]